MIKSVSDFYISIQIPVSESKNISKSWGITNYRFGCGLEIIRATEPAFFFPYDEFSPDPCLGPFRLRVAELYYIHIRIPSVYGSRSLHESIWPLFLASAGEKRKKVLRVGGGRRITYWCVRLCGPVNYLSTNTTCYFQVIKTKEKKKRICYQSSFYLFGCFMILFILCLSI